MFRFTYTLDDNDYFEFNKHHIYYSAMNKKRAKFAPFYWVVIFMLFGFILAQALNDPFSYYVYGALSILWVIFYKQINNAALKRRIKSMKKAGKLPYSHQVTMSFMEDCIIEKEEASEAKSEYSLIENVMMGETAVYVYKSAISAYIVPNRVFQNAEEKKSFIEFVQSKIIPREDIYT